jgi:transcriptional regulator with XRE-family HTH domain
MQKKLRQEDVADLLGISQRAYCKIENDEVGVKIDRLEQIAKALSVDLTQLLPSPPNQQIDYVTHSQIGSGKVVNQTGEKERELFERIIKHQAEEIAYLKGLLNSLTKA